MSKITEYTSVNTFDSGDVLLKDGSNGTKIIPVEAAASEFLRLGGQNTKNEQIETALTNFGSNLAGLEAEYVATNDYAVGDFFMVENKLYKATEAISDGDTITPDTNCVETDISTEFKATKEVVDGLSEEIVKKANVDGYYTNLAAGTADQLMASQKVHNSDPYIFRTSGGTSDIGNREELEIVGGSVVWNQFMRFASNYIPTSTDEITLETVDGTAVKLNGTPTLPKSNTGWFGLTNSSDGGFIADRLGHKFLFSTTLISGSIEGTVRFTGSDNGMGNCDIGTSKVFILTGAARSTFTIAANAVCNNAVITGICVDLTLMFGSEIADHIYELEQATAGAGVAWFRKYFPNDYYDYNPGELMHVTDLQSHDTIGFNLWDEEWEVGTLTQGVPQSGGSNIRSKNYNRIFPDTTYYAKFPTGTKMYLALYDTNMGFLGYVDEVLTSSKTFTTPSDAKWFKFLMNSGYGTTYKNDICINLSWSGTRDGEYEPYVKHSYPLDPSLTLRGIPKLTADGDLTYDGDIYKPDGTVERRYGIVTLNGSESWVVNSVNSGLYYITISGLKSNGKCFSNKFVRTETSGSQMIDGQMKIASTNINFKTSYATLEEWKDALALNPVIVIYELAEPTTEEAEPYTSPQIVDDWGTEEFVTTSIVPVGHNTSYPANLRDKLQHLPDLPDDDGYYMTQVEGTQMSLIRFRIPQAPAEDGTYVLKATVTNGVPVYTWVDPDAAPETEEPVEP